MRSNQTSINDDERALELFLEGRYLESYTLYKQIIEQDADNIANTYSSLATVCLNLGRIDEAEYHFLEALQLDPYNHSALLSYIDWKLTTGEHQSVSTIIDRLLQVHGDDFESQLLEVRYLLCKGDQSAIKKLHILTTKFKTNQIAQLLSVKITHEFGYYNDTIVIAKENMGSSTDHPRFYEFCAMALLQQELFTDAETIYRSMLARYPNDVRCFTGLANLEFIRGNINMAMEYSIAGLSLCPDDTAILHIYYSILVSQDKWDELEKATKPFVDTDPPAQMPLLFYLSALGKLGKYKEASNLIARHADFIPVRN